MSTALVMALAYFLILSLGTSLYLRKKVKSGSDFVTGGGTLAWPLVTAGFVLAPLGSGHTLSLGICIAQITATATAFYALGNKTIPFAPHCILLAVGLTILYIIAAGLMQAAWMNLFNAVMLIVGSFLAAFATGSWLSGHGGWKYVSNFYAQAGTTWKTSITNFSPDVLFGIIFPSLILLVFMCIYFSATAIGCSRLNALIK